MVPRRMHPKSTSVSRGPPDQLAKVRLFDWQSIPEVRIRIPLFCSLGEPSPKEETAKGHLAGGPSLSFSLASISSGPERPGRVADPLAASGLCL